MSETLLRHLAASLAATEPVALCVGFSGGADSTALLHALAQLPQARTRGLRALHVNHGLQHDSEAWAAHCQRLGEAWGVPCKVVRVQVEGDRGEGLEAAARRARHQAFATHLHEGERLVLAHHRDDQVETVLLKLLRGAGPESLGAMHTLRPLGRGQLWRPLLAVPRSQLRAYVERHELTFIEDPSNADRRLSRNYLRHEILPRLHAHWPHATDSILHSAALSRAAAEALRTQWLEALERLRDPATDSLDGQAWLALAPALRDPLLDHWLHARGLTVPTTAQRLQIERQLHESRPGKLPCIRWPGTELHIWRERLWSVPPSPIIDPQWQAEWRGDPLRLPDGGGLCLPHGAQLDPRIVVRLRRGGERIKPAGDAHTRELRDLFQQGMVPPWQRPVCPLLYAGDELVAIADRWASARGEAIFRQAGARPRWRPAR
jgi:tRNA(Ile)-lysidine synthase